MGPTTARHQLKQAQPRAPCPGSLPATQPKKLISIRIAAGGANHTSLSKWTIFPRGWMRRRCLDQMEKMQISEGGVGWGGTHLDFAFHHSPQLYLLISSSIFGAPLADKPSTLAMPPQSWTWKGAMQRNRNYSGCFAAAGVGSYTTKKKKKKALWKKKTFTYYQERSLYSFQAPISLLPKMEASWLWHRGERSIKMEKKVSPATLWSSRELWDQCWKQIHCFFFFFSFFFLKLRADTVLRYKHESK